MWGQGPSATLRPASHMKKVCIVYILCIYLNFTFSLSTVPHSPPTDIQATSTTPTEITVTWDIVPSIDQNGIITMYEVLYVPLETFTEAIGNLTRNVSMPEMSVVLTDLQEFNSYDIFVRAYTSVGEGPYSSALTITTLEDGIKRWYSRKSLKHHICSGNSI